MQRSQLFVLLAVLVVAFILTSGGLTYLYFDSFKVQPLSSSELSSAIAVTPVSSQIAQISRESDPTYSEPVRFSTTRSRSHSSDDSDNSSDNVPSFDLTSGLGLYLPFDESSGATLFDDSSPFGTDGTCSGVFCPVSGSAGRRGNALSFEGSDIVLVPNRANVHGNTSFTIASWVYIQNFSDPWATIITKINGNLDCQSRDDCSNREYGLWVEEEGFIEFDITTSNNVDRAKTSCYTERGVVRAGEWNHLAAVADGTHQSMKIYVNGRLSAECSDPYLRFGLRNSDGPVMIGRMLNAEWNPTGAALSGLLDDLRYYQNRALDSSEILALFRQ